MTTPFAHAHVSHVSKTARRRSKSLTIVDSDEEDVPERNIHRKLFLAQLQKERQKQHNNHDGQPKEQLEDQDEEQQDNESHHQSVVTRVAGGNSTQLSRKKTTSTAPNSVLMKKQMSMTTSAAEEDEQHQPTIIRGAGTNNTQLAKQPTSIITASSVLMKKQMSTTPTTVDEDEQHEPAVIRVARGPTTMSMKKKTPSTAANSTTSKKDVSSMGSDSKDSEENEQNYGHQSQIIRIPQSESTMSIRKQPSIKSNKNGNVNLFTSYNNSNLGLSQISSNPYQSSSINLISKSEIFDQDFHLDDNKDHVKRNDAKNRGKVNISGREKHYGNYDRKLYARSSASFMASVIGIIIGIIAFALGLTALVLVLLLRSTVANELGTNSSSSSSSSGNGSWLYACSAYTTVDDPTRNVNAAGYALGCDNSAPFSNRTTPVWIRFIGTGGTTIPLATPGLNLCGSAGTGWYDGSMPSSGNMANGTACFTWYTSVCLYSVSISVVNCGSFYIYLLPPAPACMMRYCTI